MRVLDLATGDRRTVRTKLSLDSQQINCSDFRTSQHQSRASPDYSAQAMMRHGHLFVERRIVQLESTSVFFPAYATALAGLTGADGQFDASTRRRAE